MVRLKREIAAKNHSADCKTENHGLKTTEGHNSKRVLITHRRKQGRLGKDTMELQGFLRVTRAEGGPEAPLSAAARRAPSPAHKTSARS